MNRRFTFDRKPYFLLLPALAVTLAACNGDPVESTSDSDSETDTDTTTDTSTSEPLPTTSTDPSTTSTTDPDPTVPDPTTSTTDPVTTEPDPTTSTDPSTTTTGDTESTTTTTGDTETSTTTTGDTETTTDTTTDDTTTNSDVFELASVWATSNPALLAADAIVGIKPDLAAQIAKITPTGDVLSIESIDISTSGDGYITVDLPGAVGGIILDDDMANNPPATGAIGLGQRFIRGPLTELKTPKGVEADVPGGIFLVADTTAKDIKAFDNDDSGDVAPLFKISNLGGSPAVWDIHYDSATDTLFASGTDGVVRIYDDFSGDHGATGPSRSVTPSQNGTKISVNLHGIDSIGDVLFLTDVGDANNTTDGQVFIIEDINDATGNTNVLKKFTGGKLGNPVDIVAIPGFISNTLHVAEKSNDALINFNQTLLGEYQINTTFTRTKLESVARINNNSLMLASNPAGLDADQALVQSTLSDVAATSVLSLLGSFTSVESIAFIGGTGLVSFDAPASASGGGVFTIPGLSDIVADTPVSAVQSRLWGANTSIVAPKGIVVSEDESTLFVADFGASAVKVFAAGALLNAAPMFVLDDFGAAPWDIAYDDASDTLFVAGVDGVVRVYDAALATKGGDPSRTITPSNDQNAKISVNLHGIEYDAASDTLLLSDVGSAMSATDGQLFVIGGALAATGNTAVTAQVGGNMTKLGNPVDIAFDGANLYVAEKSNSFVLRYDNIAALTGTNNAAESASFALTNPESVSLYYKLVP